MAAVRRNELAVLARDRHVVQEDVGLGGTTRVRHLRIKEEARARVGATLDNEECGAGGQRLDGLTIASRQGNGSLLDVLRHRREAEDRGCGRVKRLVVGHCALQTIISGTVLSVNVHHPTSAGTVSTVSPH